MSKGDDTKYKKRGKNLYNDIVRLVSLLQRALETGKSNYVEMNEIDKYFTYCVRTHADDISLYMNNMLIKYKNDIRYKQIRNDLLRVFKSIDKTGMNGYEKLITTNGKINKSLLEKLVQFDTEITTSMNMIKTAFKIAKSRGEMTEEEIHEISFMVNELMITFSKRKSEVNL